MDYDKTKMPASYDAGRGYSPQTLALWLDVIARAAPEPCTRILDLGCGTGRFSRPIAEHFNTGVIAIDPSEAMLAEARKKASPHVRYERGAGENIPLPDSSVDMVFMSMVFHHFKDRDRVAAECHRVLRDEGRIAMRAGATDKIAQFGYIDFFPEALPIMERSLQTRASIEATFAGAGFRTVSHAIVQSPAAASWDDYAQRVSLRADSILVQLDDAAFARGVAALTAYAATMPPDEPVIEPVDFFVFQKTPGISR
jgi:ubiquinone/menaquinone biosynthesis C-methylase UbiE